MITRPRTAYYKATAALKRAAGFRFEAAYQELPTYPNALAGAVSQGQAIELSGTIPGQAPQHWKVFRDAAAYRAYRLADGRWTRYSGAIQFTYPERQAVPTLLLHAISMLDAHETETRKRVMMALSGPGVAAEIDGQECMRFGASLDEEGSFYWITFYLASGHFARIARAGPGIGGQVTFTKVGEPVAISDPELG